MTFGGDRRRGLSVWAGALATWLAIAGCQVAQPVVQVPMAGPAACQGERLAATLNEIADDLKGIEYAQPYRAGWTTDCSGMFHRVLELLEKRCPAYAYPAVHEHRETRQLARFYHDRGQLTIVRDVSSAQDLIRPGSVMFYGYADQSFEGVRIEQLETRGRGIEHMGIVVRVERDGDTVTNYSLFHGINYGKPSGVTEHHYGDWSNNPSFAASARRNGYKPFGFWRQPWVAVAPILVR